MQVLCLFFVCLFSASFQAFLLAGHLLAFTYYPLLPSRKGVWSLVAHFHRGFGVLLGLLKNLNVSRHFYNKKILYLTLPSGCEGILFLEETSDFTEPLLLLSIFMELRWGQLIRRSAMVSACRNSGMGIEHNGVHSEVGQAVYAQVALFIISPTNCLCLKPPPLSPTNISQKVTKEM